MLKPKKAIKKKVVKKPGAVERQAMTQFVAETKRMQKTLPNLTHPVAKSLIKQEIAHRKTLLRQWKTDIKRG